MGLFKNKKPKKDEKQFEEQKKKVEEEVNDMRETFKNYVDDKNNTIKEAEQQNIPVEDLLNKKFPEQQKDANKPIPENLYETYDWKLKLLEKSILLICIGAIAALVIWAVRMTLATDDQTIKKMVVYLVLMGMLIFIMILINLGTTTGIEIWKRFVYRFKYRKGIYVNGIIAMKSGVWKEFFIKKEDTGEIRINKKPYVPNPKLLFVYKGIPSYFYREGNPDPLNYWETRLTIKFSCDEVDNVMYSASTFDFKAWLQKNLLIFLFGVGITVIFALIAGVFAFMAYNMLKKGQYDVTPIANVCKSMYTTLTNTTQVLVSNAGTIPIPKLVT